MEYPTVRIGEVKFPHGAQKAEITFEIRMEEDCCKKKIEVDYASIVETEKLGKGDYGIPHYEKVFPLIIQKAVGEMAEKAEAIKEKTTRPETIFRATFGI